MKIKQFLKVCLFFAGILCFADQAPIAQPRKVKKIKAVRKPAVKSQLSTFLKLANEAGVVFTLPESFNEIPAINNENFSFDYAMSIPGQEFEIWLQVHSLKQNWASYQQVKNITGKMLANPDSTYIDVVKAHALAMSDDSKYFNRSLSPQTLQLYNADAGKTCLFNLANLPETKHYKYALLIALQKNHTGYIVAICLSNVKGPEFFKNINKARDCIKFKEVRGLILPIFLVYLTGYLYLLRQEKTLLFLYGRDKLQ
jgi:hypothetical protein